MFRDWLAEHYPDRMTRVMDKVREAHGGKDYDAEWGRRMRGQGGYAELIDQRFRLAVRRLGLSTDLPPLDCSLFRVPPRKGDQLELFWPSCRCQPRRRRRRLRSGAGASASVPSLGDEKPPSVSAMASSDGRSPFGRVSSASRIFSRCSGMVPQ